MPPDTPEAMDDFLQRGWTKDQVREMQMNGAIRPEQTGRPLRSLPGTRGFASPPRPKGSAARRADYPDGRPVIALGVMVLAVLAVASVAMLFEDPAAETSALASASAGAPALRIQQPVASATFTADGSCEDGGHCAVVPLSATGGQDVTWAIESGPGTVAAELAGASVEARLPGTCDGTAYAVSLLSGEDVVDQVTIWVQAPC